MTTPKVDRKAIQRDEQEASEPPSIRLSKVEKLGLDQLDDDELLQNVVRVHSRQLSRMAQMPTHRWQVLSQQSIEDAATTSRMSDGVPIRGWKLRPVHVTADDTENSEPVAQDSREPLRNSVMRITPIKLNRRERQVLLSMLYGLSEKQAAVALELKPNTIHAYLKSVYQRLGVKSRGELLALWIDQNLACQSLGVALDEETISRMSSPAIRSHIDHGGITVAV